MGVNAKVRCTWAILGRPSTGLCPGAVLPDIRRDVRASVGGTELWSVTGDIVVCDGALVRSNGYQGTASKSVVRGLSRRGRGLGAPLDPIDRRPCWFRFDHQRKMRNIIAIPITSPPITPPAIAPAIVLVLMEALVLSAFAIELFAAGEALVRVPVVKLVSLV